MLLRQLFDPDTWTYTYLIADPDTGDAALIDPVRDQIDRDLQLMQELGLTLKYALDTHVHADHVTGAGVLRERTGCKTVASEAGPESADIRLADGAHLPLGKLSIEAIATPGHTDDSMSFRVGDELFTGDTLFVRGCGRSDFQNGDATSLYHSITEKLFAFDDATRVWPGHDYKGRTMSTVGEEKQHNPRLAGKSLAQFVEIMDSLGLPPPKYLQEAVPANRELGLGIGPSEAPGTFAECAGDEVDGRGPWDRIVDVREGHEFNGELGHMGGAQNIPMGLFPTAAEGWDKSASILVVCRSGRRSRAVCEQLYGQGFQNVTNLRGGMLDYRERGAA